MNESGVDSNLQLWMAVVSTAGVAMLAALAFFMRAWFSGLRREMAEDREEAKAERVAHRDTHGKMWDAMGNIRSTAEAAQNKVDAHIDTKHSLK